MRANTSSRLARSAARFSGVRCARLYSFLRTPGRSAACNSPIRPKSGRSVSTDSKNAREDGSSHPATRASNCSRVFNKASMLTGAVVIPLNGSRRLPQNLPVQEAPACPTPVWGCRSDTRETYATMTDLPFRPSAAVPHRTGPVDAIAKERPKACRHTGRQNPAPALRRSRRLPPPSA